MVDVAEYINEVKRDSDTLHIIDDIQVNLMKWHSFTQGTRLCV